MWTSGMSVVPHYHHFYYLNWLTSLVRQQHAYSIENYYLGMRGSAPVITHL